MSSGLVSPHLKPRIQRLRETLGGKEFLTLIIGTLVLKGSWKKSAPFYEVEREAGHSSDKVWTVW